MTSEQGAGKSKTKKTAVQKTPKAVTEGYRNHLRAVSAEHFLTKPEFYRAVTLAALSHVTGYKPSISQWSPSFKEAVAEGLKQDGAFMNEQISLAVRYYATESKDDPSNQTRSVVDLMIRSFKESDQRVSLSTQKWTPTQEILNNYTKSGIESLCRSAGFIAAYEAVDKQSFNALLGKGKKDLIKAILKFKFDLERLRSG